MSFQAYLDTILLKTGKTPADFRVLAEQKGLLGDDVKTGQIIAWLNDDFGLGRGHAMAIVQTLRPTAGSTKPQGEQLDKLFGGGKAKWRPVYESLLVGISNSHPVEIGLTNSYVSLLKPAAGGAGKKFAIVAPTADRLDVGLKLKGELHLDAAAAAQLEPSGTWNPMVTHRARITDTAQPTDTLLTLLLEAYDRA
ncbi:hypothetical protein BH09ACT1_BH09ACT1_04670 [soil metagenome]